MCQSFFAVFKKQPVTIEEFVQGEFHKYVNNNGFHIPSTSVEFDEVYEKAQCLVHHSYQISEKKLMLLDVQGSFFLSCTIQKLQQQIFLLMMHHWIQTRSTSVLATFSVLQFYEFNSKHSCNKYCDMMSLKVFDENGI